MKTLGMKLMGVVFMLTGLATQAQNRAEVPGDHFSLEGALELFKKSASPEEFERLLNLPESEVNNLDLNGDEVIDYIRVINRQDGNIHAFTLQAVISQNEFQDIAVITLEKQVDGQAVLQITGDADIYGLETIIEPTEEVRVNAGTTTARTYVNVWTWPVVRYVYNPYYSPWVSPWYWDYWPYWWNTWRPVSYVVYYPRWNRYLPYYRYCDAPRIRYGYRIYEPYRTSSMIVYNRHHDQISRYRSTHTVSGATRGRDRNDYRYRDLRDEMPSKTDDRTTRTEWNARENRQRSETWRNSEPTTTPERTLRSRSDEGQTRSSSWDPAQFRNREEPRQNNSTTTPNRTFNSRSEQRQQSQWQQFNREVQRNQSDNRSKGLTNPTRQTETRSAPNNWRSQTTRQPEQRQLERSSERQSSSSVGSRSPRKGRD